MLVLGGATCGGTEPIGTLDTHVDGQDGQPSQDPVPLPDPRPPRDVPADLGTLGDLDVVRYSIAVDLDVDGGSVRGTTTIHARVSRAGRAFALDLEAAATVDRVAGFAPDSRRVG